ncbi:MAG TPA: TetR/AcrR family transcriptional regulator [Candidatus Polarisedimenticolaceae bacterium]|nr:TetR/AcrR family transcriptional regulator [Candidatus Polarisedimenticolaceae bacterium]
MNETAEVVRDRAAGEDRRVRRTRQALVQALVELVLAKRYERITIQDLLERADVGRSTFYAHFRGKDDLLLRSFERMLEHFDRALDGDGPASPRIAPVRELFQHVGEARRFHQALVRARMVERLYQVGAAQLARTIERRLPANTDRAPRAVQAQAHAGALFALLRWWLDQDAPYPAERMDEIFHALRFD